MIMIICKEQTKKLSKHTAQQKWLCSTQRDTGNRIFFVWCTQRFAPNLEQKACPRRSQLLLGLEDKILSRRWCARRKQVSDVDRAGWRVMTTHGRDDKMRPYPLSPTLRMAKLQDATIGVLNIQFSLNLVQFGV
jgi:hypothetical protein